MRQSLEALPITAEMPGYRGQWTVMGDLHLAYEHCAAGSNIDPLISIYPDRACPVEHWGYIFSGSVRVDFVDGHEEVFSAGDAFHVPPGHRPYMVQDTVLLQITRRDEHAAMMEELRAAGVLPG